MPRGGEFVPHPGAYGEILSSPGVRDMIDGAAASAARRAGSGFDWNSRQGTRRWRAIVYPATHSARARNARDNTLIVALNATSV